jgi:hypothetical protein
MFAYLQLLSQKQHVISSLHHGSLHALTRFPAYTRMFVFVSIIIETLHLSLYIRIYIYIYIYIIPSLHHVDLHAVYICTFMYVCMYMYTHIVRIHVIGLRDGGQLYIYIYIYI